MPLRQLSDRKAPNKLTDTQIGIRIVPQRLRWPKSGSSVAWTKAHDCVNALQGLVRSVDIACIEAEQDRELFCRWDCPPSR